MLKEIEVAAEAFGVKLQYLDVLDPKDIETAFRAASKSGLRRPCLAGLSLDSHRKQL